MRSDYATKHQPSVRLGMLLYLGYLAIFFSTWAINGVDYNRIGQNVETTKLWYAFPTLFGCAFLVVAITMLGWWRSSLFDKSKSGCSELTVADVEATPTTVGRIMTVIFAVAPAGIGPRLAVTTPA